MTNYPSNEELWKQRFILATYAQSNDVASTKSFAESLGIEFDEKKILFDVESLFGSDTANTLRVWWDEVRQDEFDKKLERMLLLKAKELREEDSEVNKTTQQPNYSSATRAADFARDLLLTVTRSIRELLNPLSPAQWSSRGLTLMGATRGGTHKEKDADSRSSPEIEPSLSVEGDSLIIWLRLRTSGSNLPTTSDAIFLFVDGEPLTDFIFHRESDDTIALEANIGSVFMSDIGRGNITATFKSDLSEVSVYLARQ